VLKALIIAMSYVKAFFVYNGNGEELEVHGGELRIDVKKNPYGLDVPEGIKTGKEYVKWGRKNKEMVSGIVEERIDMGLSVIKTDEDKQRWMEYLRGRHIPNFADDNVLDTGYPYNSVVNLDNDTFISMKRNWYDHYNGYLPEDWKYYEVCPELMEKIVDRYNKKEVA